MMSGAPDSGRASRWPTWASAALIIVLLAAGITWAIIANRPPADSSRRGNVVSAVPTPQPTDAAPPTPGATTPVTKPQDDPDVPIDQPAEPVKGAVVTVEKLEAVTAGRDIPGEKSGPAVQVTVRITNKGTTPIDTAGSNVTLTFGGDERIPAVALTGEGATAWPDKIAPGAKSDASFLFSVPLAAEGDIRVIVDLLASAPDVAFVGPRP